MKVFDGISVDECRCKAGTCAMYVEPPHQCVLRMKGVVVIVYCKSCEAGTWHQNGKCLRCELVEANKKLQKN